MKLYELSAYWEDIAYIANLELPWERLKNEAVLISGASGLVGSVLVDTIMYLNKEKNINCTVYALGRNSERAKARFEYCWEDKNFVFISGDINKPLVLEDVGRIKYVFHLASNTHPVAYATDPIGTISTNILGTYSILNFALEHDSERVLFASSNEIYGENRGDVEKFTEEYCGYINSNTMRAGYPESKRCGEALCQAYIKQKGIDVVIPRLTRSYGPSLLMTDTKALSQFLRKAIADEDIVLKSAGTQYYSYTYVADAVSGLLTVLFLGKCGEAYNIADEASDIRLKDLAALIAGTCGRKVVFELPDQIEASGFSKATKARLDSTKVKALGWKSEYTIERGIQKTIELLKAINAG